MRTINSYMKKGKKLIRINVLVKNTYPVTDKLKNNVKSQALI